MQKKDLGKPHFNLKNFLFGTINRRLLLSFLLSAVIPLVIIGYISFRSSSDILIDTSLISMEKDIDWHAKEINLSLNRFRDNIFFISNTPPIQGIIRARANDGVDPYDDSTYEQWIDRLAVIFKAIASSDSAYTQIRYLDEDGNELVRINSNDKTIMRVSEEELQNKKNRHYFTETMVMDKDTIYISKLELNREGNLLQIEAPHKPVIRYATPIFDSEGARKGIVIANISFEPLLNTLNSVSKEERSVAEDQYKGITEFLIDKDGFYLIHPQESKRWGGPQDLDTGENLKNDFSMDMASQIISGASGAVDMPEHEHVLTYKPIFPDKENKDQFWVIFKITQRDVALAPVLYFKNILLVIGSIFLLLVIILAYFTSRLISKPIKTLRQGINIIEKGNLDHKVSTGAPDEIGQLSRSFDKMIGVIKKSRLEIEQKVEEQTRDIRGQQEKLKKQQRAILNILEDIKEEKDKVSREKEKVDTILYSIGDGVFVIDADYKIVLLNQVTAAISGFNVEESIGKKYNEILKFVFEESKKTNDKFIKDVFKTGKVQGMSGHTLLITKNGKEVPVADSAAPLKDKDGKVTGVVVVFRDITHEREVDRAKTEFVSLASHQLRTPLTSINWYAEMLLSGDAGKLSDEQKQFLDEIYEGNKRMVDLVNALLNVSRIELGTFTVEPEPTDFNKVAESVLDELKPTIQKKNLQVKVDYGKDLPKINADPKLIRIVFQNLLSNAVKYTLDRGQVSLGIRKQDRNVLITVGDTGMGIPKNQHDKIFSKLFRADNAKSTDVEGTGLGLYLVKSIVDAAKGKVWFESEEDKGTTFYASIPLTGMEKKEGTKKLK
ncbi:PAS domain-containing protein [Candidatus Falkowbacteria bacterium]|nr:PAS domain-containing protein [Candidatus Falkowbacteria bacterium]